MTEKDFIQKWVDKIKSELKKFPDDFVHSDNFETVSLPVKILFLNPPLFGSYQLTDEAGDTHYSTDDMFRAKYVYYASRMRPDSVHIPVDQLHTYETVRDYERYLDGFLKEMEKDFKQIFQKTKGFKIISAQVFSTLNLTRT
ncbi:MAG: hypothetical protein FJ214_08745 [Ignavibacteria bacterium]|nr:hypothetical protein [Ignavibacteria bacterium]